LPDGAAVVMMSSMCALKLLSESLPAATGKTFSRKYIALGRIVTQWKDIVGEDVAAIAQPLKLHYRKAKEGQKSSPASLDIAVSSASATLLHYRKDLILERINAIFGSGWVDSIRFVHLPSTPKEGKRARARGPLKPDQEKYLAETLENITDSDVKERLTRFGAAFLQDKN